MEFEIKSIDKLKSEPRKLYLRKIIRAMKILKENEYFFVPLLKGVEVKKLHKSIWAATQRYSTYTKEYSVRTIRNDSGKVIGCNIIKRPV